MTLEIDFVLVGEGTTEKGLIPVLAQLCLRCGASVATGRFPDLGRLPPPTQKPRRASTSLSEKVRRALELAPSTNLLFIHRDADARDTTPRYQEIQQAAQSLALPHVAVVPIQETEAWLLLDEAEIRRVAGNPKGRIHLDLPQPRQVEALANPKERLKAILARASELKGRRLAEFQSEKSFGGQRKLLLDALSEQLDGPIQHLSAWQQLNDDLQAAIDTLKEAEGHTP